MVNELGLFWMLFFSVAPTNAQSNVGVNAPSVSISINLAQYPELELVPGYPVYYAPRLNSNYFFYDGMFWVYDMDGWYRSSWYNGPWRLTQPDMVPLYILRIPVNYYRQPPPYFQGWQLNSPPHWGDHWGHEWARRRSGWERWDRDSTPNSAPLPIYQRRYSGTKYPAAPQQQHLQQQNYRYQPHDPVIRPPLQAEPVLRKSDLPKSSGESSRPQKQPLSRSPNGQQPIHESNPEAVRAAHDNPVQPTSQIEPVAPHGQDRPRGKGDTDQATQGRGGDGADDRRQERRR